MIERLAANSRARGEVVRARADAEAAARNNVGAAIVAGAGRAASDATLDEREDSSRTRLRSTPPWRRARARWVPRGARRRGGHRSSRGEKGRCIRSRRRFAAVWGADARRARETIRRVAASVRAAASESRRGGFGALVFT